jgi:hypothetical protein
MDFPIEDGLKMELLDLLTGKWLGEGRGEYPTITSFQYRESLIFTKAGDGLHYDQITHREASPGEYVPSHRESGFLRFLDDGLIEIANVQVGGRVEILNGTIGKEAAGIVLRLESVYLANDPRMEKSTRVISVGKDKLHYTMQMQTNRVNYLALHLEATLTKSKG